MFLFTILLLIFIILIVAVVLIISTVGAAGIIIFGDVIVCICIIGAILYWLIKKRKDE